MTNIHGLHTEYFKLHIKPFILIIYFMIWQKKITRVSTQIYQIYENQPLHGVAVLMCIQAILMAYKPNLIQAFF